ncbi:DUF2271 domain-containing protein [Ferrimonas marina]|uniref:DUF2271 domain-containing protein n=1 Tax=Ferrimonas marina TaxID=299255 RepID=A0A1M5VC85_9GAMM|nr:DUF2271 domain-containing protein [Ferrimonas marina]SHH72724.1 Hypothetical protein SAMN02745129_2698 [Ferrimonas marina]
MNRLSLVAAAFGLLASSTLSATTLSDDANMTIQFELPQLDVAQYARPYVAIWLENSDRESVRTITLWTGKQTEWLKDIRSWWRKVGRYDAEFADALSGATRPAGQYRVEWDGKDDNGQLVPAGEYTLMTEVVREHGGRDLVRMPITLGDAPFTQSSEAQDEIGVISLSYQP